MSQQRPPVADMVADIVARLPLLDASRRRMFFLWLQAHHAGTCISEATLQDCLTEWFDALPAQGLDWEYHLMLSEIEWWRDLDEQSLAEFMRSEGMLHGQDEMRSDYASPYPGS